MGLGTLTNRSAGQTILDTFFNDIHGAINGDFVGRNTSGVPTAAQNLGTTAFPWGVIRGDSLVLDGSAVDTSQLVSPQNRVVSGKTRTTSNQPAFLTPNGAAASFILAGATTNLVLDINGTAVSVTTDISKTGLTVAPAAQNTCLLNDADAAAQEDTRTWGEYGHRKSLTVDTMGTTMDDYIGKWVAIKIAGTATEYALAFMESATSLTKVMRGYFYDSTLAPVNRTKLTNNDVITLMSLGWVFVTNDGLTVDVSYSNPTWDFVSPSSPATGDYWYDMANETWKRYDGATFEIINRTFVGNVVIDTANCVAARAADFYAPYKPDNTLELEISTTEIVRATERGQMVSVAGVDVKFKGSIPAWNITTDLAASADMYNATEQASTKYYLYIKDTGDTAISDIRPYWRADLQGWYHPHNPWREVGSAHNNASSNIVNVGGRYNARHEIWLYTANGYGVTSTKVRRWTTTGRNIGTAILYADDANLAGTFTITEPDFYTIDYFDQFSAASKMGLSLNSTQLSTATESITAATRLASTTTGNTNYAGAMSVRQFFQIGDVIRTHNTGDASGVNTTQESFRITQG